jgi:hypothetical protein
MRKAEATQSTLDAIPKATLRPIRMRNVDNPKSIMGVVVDDRLVATVSKRYKLVQHQEAFDPIFKGLHKVGSDYDFALYQTDTKAWLSVFVDEVSENGSGIKVGFQAMNSLDGTTSIRYLAYSQRVTKSIEVVGYRQVCSNGMKIRVPLEEAEFVRQELREKIENLMHLSESIAHLGDIEHKIEAVQYVVEAMVLLKEPIAKIIEKAKEKRIDNQDAKKLIKEYIGKRMGKAIYEQFHEEEQTIWGLYNSITYVASHGVKTSTMNGLLNKGADLLEGEITVRNR